MKLLFCAGEPSGDTRGAELLRALALKTPVDAFGLGGDRMAEAGMDLRVHFRETAVMGFTEVIRALPRILETERTIRRLAVEEKPDAVILVDYPEFNMRLGAWARKRGIPVVQYIAPQMWAWGSWRLGRLKRACDLLLVILPFEEEFFRARGIPAVYTGHPIADSVPNPFEKPRGAGRLALLPGSRSQEVRRLLPEMMKAFGMLQRKGLVETAAVAVSQSVDSRLYSRKSHGVELAAGPGEALKGASAALVCSGTATLETAMHGVPQVICYRTGKLNFLLAGLLVRGVKRIGLANLVAGMDIAPELIQGDARADRMANSLETVLSDPAARAATGIVRRNLGAGGGAGRACDEIIKLLEGG